MLTIREAIFPTERDCFYHKIILWQENRCNFTHMWIKLGQV